MLLFTTNFRTDAPDILAPQRLLFYILVLSASLLTFAPIQQRMHLPQLTLMGTGGATLFFYTLAFVPPPTGWLLSLPDLPVYGLLIVSVFWSSVAIAFPFIYAVRQHLVKQRTQRLDIRQARRQAYEAGFLIAGVVMLSGLRVLTWISVLLLMLILITTELLFLSHRSSTSTKIET